MAPPIVLFANEPFVYREAMAGAVGAMRPDLDVRAVAPDELAAAIAREHPRFVVCSALPEAIRAHVPSWLVLYPDGAATAETQIAGVRESPRDVDLAGLLALVDRATGHAAGDAEPTDP
jgi:hypothetical protein